MSKSEDRLRKIFDDFNTKVVKKALVIGVENSDILKMLKVKNIRFSTFDTCEEVNIIKYLNRINHDEFDSIIFNLNLSDFDKMKNILELLSDRSKFTVVWFSDKKREIDLALHSKNILIFRKFYIMKNYMTKNLLFQRLAEYFVYYISKNDLNFATEISFVTKAKKFLFGENHLKLTIRENK